MGVPRKSCVWKAHKIRHALRLLSTQAVYTRNLAQSTDSLTGMSGYRLELRTNMTAEQTCKNSIDQVRWQDKHTIERCGIFSCIS